MDLSIRDFQYALEFNRLITSKVVEIKFTDKLSSVFKFK